MPEPLHPIEDPSKIGGYFVESRLGAGAMGIVYKAWSATGLPVAIKIIRPELLDDPSYRTRFRREIAAASKVPRFCTAPIIDADTDAELPYLVSEFIPGPSLAEAIRREGTKHSADLEALAVAMALALRAIHETGITHRDLKPANVLLGPYGPRVVDFGLALLSEVDDSASRSGQVVGTRAFMAPEQRHGARADSAADIYSWGATVGYAAIGHPPPILDDREDDSDQRSGIIRTYAYNIGGFVEEMIIAALSYNKSLRPTASGILDNLLAQQSSSRILINATATARPIRTITPQDADDWAARAEDSLRSSKPKLALSQAERGIELDQDHARCHYLQGRAQFELGEATRGMDSLRLAYEIDSESDDIRREYARRIVERDPTSADVAWKLAPDDELIKVKYIGRLLTEGESGVREAYQLDPLNPNARREYSRLLIRTHDSEVIREAYSISPNDPYVATLYVEDTFKQTNVVKAFAALEPEVRRGLPQEAMDSFFSLLLLNLHPGDASAFRNRQPQGFELEKLIDEALSLNPDEWIKSYLLGLRRKAFSPVSESVDLPVYMILVLMFLTFLAWIYSAIMMDRIPSEYEVIFSVILGVTALCAAGVLFSAESISTRRRRRLTRSGKTE